MLLRACVIDFSRNCPPAVSHPPSKLRSLFLAAALTALIAQLAVVRSVLSGRAPASTPGRTARVAEIAWVVLPTLVLIGVFVLTWRVLGEPVALAPVNGVTV